MFPSCSKIGGKLKIAGANFYYSRGMFVESIGSYVEALNYPDVEAYAEYGLGSAYLALEQNDAALVRFNAAEEKALADGNRELLYRIRYNSGVARFKSGDLPGAAADFKHALESDSGRVAAKLNLELCMLSLLMQRESAVVRVTQKGSVTEDSERRKREILFNFIRQKETDKWKSYEWSGESTDTGPDY
ncbi:hypothetical protein AGMMS50212_05060 [Spirochaetia bacterium]|nr:hypothetical protein AGMMS50212_05060 [Spirochaetia bacterium]